ncbi:MAG TPA: hypothetical protein VMU95_00475 [Trebonia sp.]|nr:hypothetical protein [Trebonia sp.]
MTLKKPSRKVARLLLALAFVVGITVSFSAATTQHALALSCSPGSSSTSTVDGQTVTTLTYTFGATCSNVEVDHQCADLGNHSSIHAIECADIYMSFSTSNLNLWGVGEYYCQGPFGYEQCAAMSVDQAFEFGVLGTDPSGTGVYGHPGGDYTCSGSGCPAGGRALVDTYHFSGTLAQAGGTCSYVMLTASEVTNSITVPDGTKISGSSNPAITRYMQVCFE